jgi:hypothetical protein
MGLEKILTNAYLYEQRPLVDSECQKLILIIDVAITQIGNNFGYLNRHFSAWYYFYYAIY